jgi:hypothetical protein
MSKTQPERPVFRVNTGRDLPLYLAVVGDDAHDHCAFCGAPGQLDAEFACDGCAYHR